MKKEKRDSLQVKTIDVSPSMTQQDPRVDSKESLS